MSTAVVAACAKGRPLESPMIIKIASEPIFQAEFHYAEISRMPLQPHMTKRKT